MTDVWWDKEGNKHIGPRPGQEGSGQGGAASRATKITDEELDLIEGKRKHRDRGEVMRMKDEPDASLLERFRASREGGGAATQAFVLDEPHQRYAKRAMNALRRAKVY